MPSLAHDFLVATRVLRRSPEFTTIAALCVALGVAANTAMFGVANGLLFRPLPFAQPDRLLALRELQGGRGGPGSELSYPNFADLRRQTRTVAAVAAYSLRTATISGDASGEPERASASETSASLASVLGVRPFLGRWFAEDEDRAGGPPTVVLSHGLWTRRFAGDTAAIGRTVVIDGVRRAIVGVMPPGFGFPFQSQLWTPLARDETREPRDAHWLLSVARLRDGVSLAQGSAEVDAIARALARQYPVTNANRGARLVPFRRDVLGDAAAMIGVMTALVGCVLLIACANVANLMLARAATREREMAVRAALGAGRLVLVRQLLAESVLIAVLGGAVGAALGIAGTRAAVSLLPMERPYWIRFDVDIRVILFAVGASLATGFLFGLLPALRLSRTPLYEALRSREGGQPLRGRRLRGALAVGELALSVVLLVSATLLVRSLNAAQRQSPGFDATDVLTMQLSLAGTRYDTLPARAPFHATLRERIEQMPGVAGAGAISLVPLGFESSASGMVVETRPAPPGDEPQAQIRVATSGFFRTMGIRLASGRLFTPVEERESTNLVLVNETLARRFWPGESALGKRIREAGSDSTWWIVAGVVADSKLVRLNAPAEPQVFLPYGLVPRRTMTLVVRTTEPAATLRAIRAELRERDPGIPLSAVEPQSVVVERSLFLPRLSTSLLGSFATLALVLGAAGLYGVISYLVSQRRREIGIRIALGARYGDVVRSVVGDGLVLAGAGIAIGVVAALGVSGLLSHALYGVTPRDFTSFGGVVGLLLAVSLIATVIPARRAAGVNPVDALRE